MLDECDIDHLLPFYYANTSPDDDELKNPVSAKADVVYRDGKPYKVVMVKDSMKVNNIF